ncbi:hypothetical protein ILYODFUR_038385 [Ilyodon furcidens]|uniref:Uncharacterized protein n=1 Tax=Ilyodon furcidens TaxID=33524 RepID=A0ABV0V9J4_9TELE
MEEEENTCNIRDDKQWVLKQESDVFMLIPGNVKRDFSEYGFKQDQIILQNTSKSSVPDREYAILEALSQGPMKCQRRDIKKIEVTATVLSSKLTIPRPKIVRLPSV